jgi:hypothetical protein
LPDFDMWVRFSKHYQLHILHEPLVEFRLLDNGRNASAARPEVIAREPWERLHVLRHFKDLDMAYFDQVFPHDDAMTDCAPDSPPWARLARSALAVGSPAHRLFALELLHEGLGSSSPSQCGVPGYVEYHRLCADCDVFGQGVMQPSN